ncbi:hypothetical protein [Salibacterium aidingense]|uniref:hypothetical protein n=1 Tax=Salibacterium aidingense TaxID=384933 RepID=UPI000428A875|nr:hypothetical protein [Salibacterium aidingense]
MKVEHGAPWYGKHDSLICVRSVNPLSSNYPNEHFISRNYAYILVGDTPVLITKLFDFNEYNDLSWLHREEISVLATLSICAPSIGWYSFYPGHEPVYISDSNLYSVDLKDSDTVTKLLSFANNEWSIPNSLDKTGKVNHENYLCPPQVMIKAIDNTNDSLIKSLNYWLKACMLSQHRQFREEAAALLFFAMEGILKLFHAELKKERPDIKVTDVIDYLIETFNVPDGYKDYTIMCHEHRNNYAHPFKSGWNGDFEADDLLETFGILKDLVYIYLMRRQSIEGTINEL